MLSPPRSPRHGLLLVERSSVPVHWLFGAMLSLDKPHQLVKCKQPFSPFGIVTLPTLNDWMVLAGMQSFSRSCLQPEPTQLLLTSHIPASFLKPLFHVFLPTPGAPEATPTLTFLGISEETTTHLCLKTHFVVSPVIYRTPNTLFPTSLFFTSFPVKTFTFTISGYRPPLSTDVQYLTPGPAKAGS